MTDQPTLPALSSTSSITSMSSALPPLAHTRTYTTPLRLAPPSSEAVATAFVANVVSGATSPMVVSPAVVIARELPAEGSAASPRTPRRERPSRAASRTPPLVADENATPPRAAAAAAEEARSSSKNGDACDNDDGDGDDGAESSDDDSYAPPCGPGGASPAPRCVICLSALKCKERRRADDDCGCGDDGDGDTMSAADDDSPKSVVAQAASAAVEDGSECAAASAAAMDVDDGGVTAAVPPPRRAARRPPRVLREVVVTKCGHSFHKDCLAACNAAQTGAASHACPLCRTKLTPKAPKSPAAQRDRSRTPTVREMRQRLLAASPMRSSAAGAAFTPPPLRPTAERVPSAEAPADGADGAAHTAFSTNYSSAVAAASRRARSAMQRNMHTRLSAFRYPVPTAVA